MPRYVTSAPMAITATAAIASIMERDAANVKSPWSNTYVGYLNRNSNRERMDLGSFYTRVRAFLGEGHFLSRDPLARRLAVDRRMLDLRIEPGADEHRQARHVEPQHQDHHVSMIAVRPAELLQMVPIMPSVSRPPFLSCAILRI